MQTYARAEINFLSLPVPFAMRNAWRPHDANRNWHLIKFAGISNIHCGMASAGALAVLCQQTPRAKQ